MLKLVSTDTESSQRRSLQVARAHIESAIAHINDAAQGRIGASPLLRGSTNDLRLLVTALADIRNAVAILDAEGWKQNAQGHEGIRGEPLSRD